MNSQEVVKSTANELLIAVNKLYDIYLSTAYSKSVEMISSLQLIVSYHLQVLHTDIPDDKDKFVDWVIKEGVACYLLQYVQIERIKKVRLLKSFTPEEREIILQSIKDIQRLWIDLREKKSWERFVSKFSDDFSDKFSKFVPKEWK